ncbi:MAG: hypothetical protein RIS94_1270 [Pseudomonadota bacterium]|jgi:undecaprenyl-diphosphatase
MNAAARTYPINARRALAGATVLWLGFIAIAMLVQSHRLDAWDVAGLRFWRQGGNAATLRGPWWLAAFAETVTTFGAPLFRNAVVLICAVLLLRLRAQRLAFGLLITVAAAWVAGDVMKAWFGRIRPDAVPHLVVATGNSFPSGHSLNAAAVYIALALAAAPWVESKGIRRTIVACAMMLSLLVALTRVWLGVHYPTDAIAGWLAGAGCAFLMPAALACRAAR